MAIIVSKSGKNASVIERASIEKEDYLQAYIHENPDSIPIYEIKKDRKLLVVAREYETVSGPIDALAVDADGDIYIVETKLYKNPDKRKVVAQALDYGASFWRHSRDFDLIMEKFDNEIEKKFQVSFEEKVVQFFDLDIDGYSRLKEGIKQNLNTGTLRFMIMMDTMDERLKDLILYINQNSNFDIYGVELDFYNFEEYEIVVPRMFGVEVKKSISTGTSSEGRRVWDEESYFSQVEEKLGERAKEHIEFYKFCKKYSDDINWGTGKTKGSFTPIMKNIHPTIFPLSFFSNELLWVKISWYIGRMNIDDINIIKKIIINELNENGKEKISRYDVMKDLPNLYIADFEDGYQGLKRVIQSLRDIKTSLE
jgi:hypothetical protein